MFPCAVLPYYCEFNDTCVMPFPHTQKPRLQDRKSPSAGQVDSDKRAKNRRLSRKRAQVYAQTLLATSNDGARAEMSGADSGSSDGEDDNGSVTDGDTASPDMYMTERSEPPPALKSRPMTYPSSPRRRGAGLSPKRKPRPMLPEAPLSGRRDFSVALQPSPPLASPTPPQDTSRTRGHSTGRAAHQSSRISSFLRHAGGKTTADATGTPMQESRRSSSRPSLAHGEPDELAAGPPEQRTPRQSFLSRVRGNRGTDEVKTTAPATQSLRKRSTRQQRDEVERVTTDGVNSGAGSSSDGGSQGRVTAWAYTW